MDDKKQAKKNRLDLEYHGESQKRNAMLILLTTGILGFIGIFVWLGKTSLFYYGAFIIILAATLGFLGYRKTTKRMKEILLEIEDIQ